MTETTKYVWKDIKTMPAETECLVHWAKFKGFNGTFNIGWYDFSDERYPTVRQYLYGPHPCSEQQDIDEKLEEPTHWCPIPEWSDIFEKMEIPNEST